MYYRSGTGGHCCIAPGIHCVYIHQVAALFCTFLSEIKPD